MMELELKKKQVVEFFLKKNILPKKEVIDSVTDNTDPEEVYNRFFLQQENQNSQQATQLEVLPKENQTLQQFPVKVTNYFTNDKVRTLQDFVLYFQSRLKALERILHGRQDLKNVTSIQRVNSLKAKEPVAIIGMVYDKQISKNGNIMLTIEDFTGAIKVVFTKSNPAVFEAANDIALDEVIGITGTANGKIIFGREFFVPDVPLGREIKKSPDECCVAVISDLHVGSKFFTRAEFEDCLQWLRGESDRYDTALAKNIKYILLTGDLVDGVGIYPRQEDELEIKDIFEQYSVCADLLKRIPEDKKLIISAGNHDAVRLSEPQPLLINNYTKPLVELKNAVFTTNPAMINLHSSPDFPGFDLLLYHGYGYDDYGESVPSIKLSGKNISDRVVAIMKFLLQRRHLAPTHGSTLYIPDAKRDALVIEQIPDLLISGHIHKSASAFYRGVGLVCGSCWQTQTSFQEKVGHVPSPCILPVINLKTREILMLDFSRKSEIK